MKNIIVVILILVAPALALAHPGIGIVEDSKGNIYYTDLRQVWQINFENKKSIVVPQVHTHELYIDENDNLFGEHVWYNGEPKNTRGYNVWKLSPSGKIEKIIPDTEGFRKNYSFVRDESGNQFNADRSGPCHKVVKGRNNNFKAHGERCYHNIRNIAVSKSGDLLVLISRTS